MLDLVCSWKDDVVEVENLHFKINLNLITRLIEIPIKAEKLLW